MRYAPGSVTVRRAGRRFVLRDDRRLRTGDRLEVRATRGLTLLLPGHQWIIVHGALRLDSLPEHGARRSRSTPRVALVAGRLRARATERGGGLLIAAARRRVAVDRGEFRVRYASAGLRVESLDAYAQIRGPHAARRLSPGSGLTLGARPGFSAHLLPAPRDLRPVQARGFAPPVLRWGASAGAHYYRVVVARDAGFSHIVARRDGSHRRLALGALPPGKYFWKVVPATRGKLGQPSKIYSFEILSGELR